MTLHCDDWRPAAVSEGGASPCFTGVEWRRGSCLYALHGGCGLKSNAENKRSPASRKVTFLFVQLQLLTRKCQMPGKLMQGLGMVPPFTMVGQHSLAYPLSGDCL